MPKAPKLLGSLVGLAIAEGAVPAGKLVELYEKVEDTETRRRGVAEALRYVKVRRSACNRVQVDPLPMF